MNTVYTFPKWNINKRGVHSLKLIFDNGNYVTLKGLELIDISINFYDRLVRYGQGVTPVVESGYIKLKILNKVTASYDYSVYNPKLIKKGRKEYIENRCLSESKIKEIWLIDNYNWKKILLGNIVAKMENEYLLLEFTPIQSMGECLSDKHYINWGNLEKEHIFSIDIDFENCEGFMVYSDEIKEINIEFEKELQWGSSKIVRCIKEGHLIIELNKERNDRNYSFLDDITPKIKHFERRLCGKRGFDVHDICHLYITSYNCYGNDNEECISVEDFRTQEEYEEYEKLCEYEQMGYDYQSGYCKKLKNGSLVITFGKHSKEEILKFN